MVNVFQRRHEKRSFFADKNRQNTDRRQMIEEDCRSKASGALQQKIWKLGELKTTKKEHHDEMDDQIQQKFWDPGILKMEGYDQEVIYLSS